MKLKTATEIKRFRLKRNSKACGVYFLFDKDVIVYIGQSTDIHRRINHHRQFNWDRYSIIEMKEGRALRDLEREYIRSIRPAHNKKV